MLPPSLKSTECTSQSALCNLTRVRSEDRSFLSWKRKLAVYSRLLLFER